MSLPWINTVSLSLLATATFLISGWSDRSISPQPTDLQLVPAYQTPSLETQPIRAWQPGVWRQSNPPTVDTISA
ncbi:MAG: hypothetical protein KME35_15160 [Aphanocapsa sp. GSE-SYN-MK-11-07L]|jgi:hypothetical protein|nr:hypothetical protein [Aphanocapsa sp. GSE-SYN-MK-11-07L]